MEEEMGVGEVGRRSCFGRDQGERVVIKIPDT